MAIVAGLPAKIAVPAILALIAIAAAAGVTEITRQAKTPTYAQDDKVPADAYQRPPGCPNLNYRAREHLPKTCTYRRRYRLTNHADLGLSVGKGEIWYRVGNDALLLNCQTWGKSCIIKRYVGDKFGK